MCEVILMTGDDTRHEQYDIVATSEVKGAVTGRRINVQNEASMRSLMDWLAKYQPCVGDRLVLVRRPTRPVVVEEPPFHNALSQEELRDLGLAP